MLRTLVVGYGNLDRQDDGVAFEVINSLRLRLGQTPLVEEEIEPDKPENQVNSIFLRQLAPELLEVVAEYDRVVFVDAHVQTDIPALTWAAVHPEYTSSAFTHHMTPAMFLALLQVLYHHEPRGYLVSIRGRAFDFQRGLSDSTAALVEPAAERILQLIVGPDGDLHPATQIRPIECKEKEYGQDPCGG
jgi:hydrogenase maturation protease